MLTKKAGKNAESADPILQLERDLLARRNNDGSVAIMQLNNDEFFFVLDGIAAEFWVLIDGATSLTSIKERLVRKHKPPAAQFEKDVAQLVTDLKTERLVRDK